MERLSGFANHTFKATLGKLAHLSATFGTLMRKYLSLWVDWRRKSVPYPPERRQDGENFGFTALKGHPERAATINEASDEPSLISMIAAVNQAETPFFTVGCEKLYNDGPDDTARPIGFIEVCFNSIALAQKIDSYFCLFMRLHARMARDYDLPVGYEWSIDPAEFSDIDVQGYTAVIYIKPFERIDRTHALKNWRESVGYLERFLMEDQPPGDTPPMFYPAAQQGAAGDL